MKTITINLSIESFCRVYKQKVNINRKSFREMKDYPYIYYLARKMLARLLSKS